MKKITFTEDEINELKSFYYEELDRITRRMEVIKGFMNKLGAEAPKTNVDTLTDKPIKGKRGRKPKNQPNMVFSDTPTPSSKTKNVADKNKSVKKANTEKKKPGRKSKWGAYIFSELNKKAIPLPATDLVNNAIKHFNAKNDIEKENVRNSIIGVLSKLSTREKTIIQFREKGIKTKYFSLPEWLDEKGELILPISQKFENNKK